MNVVGAKKIGILGGIHENSGGISHYRNRLREHSEFFKSDFFTLNLINYFRSRIFNLSAKKIPENRRNDE